MNTYLRTRKRLRVLACVLVGGEITTTGYVDIPKIARGVVEEIGYTDAGYGFDCTTCSVLTSIDEQSPDIKQGVDDAYRLAVTRVMAMIIGDLSCRSSVLGC